MSLTIKYELPPRQQALTDLATILDRIAKRRTRRDAAHDALRREIEVKNREWLAGVDKLVAESDALIAVARKQLSTQGDLSGLELRILDNRDWRSSGEPRPNAEIKKPAWPFPSGSKPEAYAATAGVAIATVASGVYAPPVKQHLPTWDESYSAVLKSCENPLERFIYANEPANDADAAIWRYALEDALNYWKNKT